nr:MAG TPA: type I neck protein [Bacteriophage sp.]
MGKLRIKLNRKGVRELLQSQQIMDECKRIAQEKAAAAGDGYQSSSGYVGKTRVSVTVYPSTSAARNDNYRNNTLLKVFGSALKVRGGK